MPPMPSTTLRSPKDSEHVASLKKVSVKTFSPSFIPAPVGLQLTSIHVAGNQVELSWINGVGPFMIEQSDLTGSWFAVGELTMARTQTVTSFSPEAYFRIHDKVPMPMTAEEKPDGVHLAWTPPTF